MDVINHVVALAALGIVTGNSFNNVKKEKSCFHIITTTNHSLIKNNNNNKNKPVFWEDA